MSDFMKEIVPSIYKDFHCIAGECRHNCCIGWEIDIDEDTLAFYRAQTGAFGARLRQNIEVSQGCASFRLNAHERCPFLNGQNLCEVYLTLGETALCQICRDHPRFRNFFSDRTETGLGLCCAEAARLALCTDVPFSLAVLADDSEQTVPTARETAFFAFREQLFQTVQARCFPLKDRLTAVCTRCGVHLPQKSPAVWADFYSDLERLDKSWDAVLEKLRLLPTAAYNVPFAKDAESFFENLFCYLLYRHLAGALENGDYAARTAFAVHAVQLLWALYRANAKNSTAFDFDLAKDLVRQYSTEIEYSEENLEAVLRLLSADC